MLRRFLTGGLIAVVVASIVLVIILLNRDNFEEKHAENAVPPGAILFADNLDFSYFSKGFREQNEIWRELLEIPGMREYDSLFHNFTARLKQVPVLNGLVHDRQLNISLHLQGKSRLAALFLLETGAELHRAEIQAGLEALFGNDAIINERRYEAVEMYDVSLEPGFPVGQLSYTISDGLVILSTSSLLVEESVRTLHSGSGIGTREAFIQVAETAGKYVQGNLYINYGKLGGLLAPVLTSRASSLHPGLNSLAEWGAFDIDIQEDAVVLNGMTIVIDSSSQWLNLFAKQSPVRNEIMSVVPSNTNSMFSSGISDPGQFLSQLKQYYTEVVNSRQFANHDSRYRELFGSSPLTDLAELMDNELVRFTLEGELAGEYHSVTMLEVRSHARTIESIVNWIDGYVRNSETAREALIHEYALDDQTVYRIFHLPMELYSGTTVAGYLGEYMSVFDNYLIFSETREAIERTIYQNILHKTLSNDPLFGEFSDYVSTRSNLTWIIKPARFTTMVEDLLNENGVKLSESLKPLLMKMPGLVFQLMNEGNMYYGNISLKYTGQVSERALTVWESLLDSMVNMKPALVENHYTRETEIFVQDASNTVCLVNSTGRILWKLKLDEAIMSDIYQVDYYRNGKLQYLFNTRSELHLLDRNGNYVERYPVKLKSDATNGMALFDYDNNRDFRIFVACADQEIYLYDLEGNIVPGWKFRKTDGTITRPLQHFRVGERDYIVAADEIRTYILNRRGRDRVKIKDMPVVSRNNEFFLDMNTQGNVPRLVTTDTGGNVIAITLEGETRVLHEHEALPGHFFRLEDLDQDGVPEYILASGDMLEVIDNSGDIVFTFNIKGDISMLPDVYQFSASDLKIGLTDTERNTIYLINADGSLYEGFPLEGSTRFSIGYFAGSDSRFNLIVGSENGFLYNYSIE